MRAITINIKDEAYEAFKQALEEHSVEEEHTVRSWLESELNDNTETIIEMLLSDF